MKKYRIVGHKKELFSPVTYTIQSKSWCGLWFNMESASNHSLLFSIPAEYSSEKEARNAIRGLEFRPKKEIIEV